jgi:TrmH family RNA methyltransferase
MDRVHVVLHRPIYPRNVGMCARAIGNMGAGRLIIVGRDEPLGIESKQGAAHAQNILRNTTFYKDLAGFYANETEGVRIALSGKDARIKVPDLLPELLTQEFRRADHRMLDSSQPIYLFFGTEDDGLSFEEMELCHFVCRLPTFTEINSLNLSHAVLLTLYIVRTALTSAKSISTLQTQVEAVQPELENKSELESIELNEAAVRYPQSLIKEWLGLLGFNLDSPRINIEKTLNRILLGRAPTTEELRTLNNILQQTVRRLKR